MSDREINSGHYHEILDRCHVISSNIDDHLIDHPGMTKEMNEKCVKVQEILYEIYNKASELQDKMLEA